MILYRYDSGQTLKEKYLVGGLSFTQKVKDLEKVHADVIQLAFLLFKKEISKKFSLVGLFEDENKEEFVKVYSKYFELPEQYFSSWFFDKFFNPNNVKVEWIQNNKDLILKNFNEFEEDYFDEKDFEILKTSYILFTLKEFYKNVPAEFKKINPRRYLNSQDLCYIFPEQLKYTRLGSKYKQNKKVRKVISLQKYIDSYLSDFDKIEIIDNQILRLNKIINVNTDNSRYFYDYAFTNVLNILEFVKVELED